MASMPPVPIGMRLDQGVQDGIGLRSGMSAYAAILDSFERARKRDRAKAEFAMRDATVALACDAYMKAGNPRARLFAFSDGVVDCIFDERLERTVLVCGHSAPAAPGTRDKAYHDGYPSAGAGYDKGHAWSHAQGGQEGGPAYFPQLRAINQGRSAAGKLWRAIERHLAANAGLFAFVRLIYRKGDTGQRPAEVEYGLMVDRTQFRAVIFRNE